MDLPDTLSFAVFGGDGVNTSTAYISIPKGLFQNYKYYKVTQGGAGTGSAANQATAGFRNDNDHGLPTISFNTNYAVNTSYNYLLVRCNKTTHGGYTDFTVTLSR